jgi:hypothetical protein
LPSFNKENFSNFHQGAYSLSLSNHRQQNSALFHCAVDKASGGSQLIVNEKFNIVVKYLKKKPVGYTQPQTNTAKRSTSVSPQRMVTEDTENFLKRRRLME